MAQRLHRVLTAGFAALTAGSLVALPSFGNLVLPSVRSSSVGAEAKAINLKVTDLSSSLHWATSAPGHSSKAEAALAVKALACLKKVGSVSPDPFGTTGAVGGVVAADLSSPSFYDKAFTLTQLPSASSEVVFLTKASGATADLATIGRSGSLGCLTAQFIGDSALQGAGKGLKGTASYLPAPRHGTGAGGAHIQFVVSGGNFALLKMKLYDNEYFYAQGPAEVSLSFINLGSPFNSSWATAAISKVMARAASEVAKA
jgi:hypothetical protein